MWSLRDPLAPPLPVPLLARVLGETVIESRKFDKAVTEYQESLNERHYETTSEEEIALATC